MSMDAADIGTADAETENTPQHGQRWLPFLSAFFFLAAFVVPFIAYVHPGPDLWAPWVDGICLTAGLATSRTIRNLLGLP